MASKKSKKTTKKSKSRKSKSAKRTAPLAGPKAESAQPMRLEVVTSNGQKEPYAFMLLGLDDVVCVSTPHSPGVVEIRVERM